MSRTTAVLCILLTSALAPAQNPGASPREPQSARQALIEAFFGQSPDHLEKHLPELAKRAFRQLDSGTGSPSFLTQLSTIGMEARRGASNFQIMESGPVLLLAEDGASGQKFEVNVERDDLVGDQNQIELSFHMYKHGQEQGLPVIPRLTFSMKTEASVWRVYDVELGVRAPLGDPDFLKTLVKNLEEKQQSSNEMWATISLNAIAGAETRYQANSSTHAFTCSLRQLAEQNNGKPGEYADMPVDNELAGGKKNGYVFALTGCDALHFKAAAEPSTPSAGHRAFCVDETGTVKSANDGKATTCLSNGELYQGPRATGLGASAID